MKPWTPPRFILILNRLLLGLTLLCGVFLVAGVLLFSFNRDNLFENARTLIEQNASQAIGLRVEVESIEGNILRGVEAKNILVHSSMKQDSPVFARIPRLTVRYSLIQLLKLGHRPVYIDAYAPSVTLERTRKGINVTPTLPPVQEGGEKVKLPRFSFALHEGRIRWKDGRFRALLTLSGHGSLQEGVAAWDLQGAEGASRIRVKGNHSLDTSDGKVELSVLDTPAKRWADYLAPSRDWQALAGRFNLTTRLSWTELTPEAIRLDGRLRFFDGKVRLAAIKAPVEEIQGRVAFDTKEVKILDASGKVAGNAVSGKGSVFLSSDPKLKLSFRAPRVQLDTMQQLITEIGPFFLKGEGSAEAEAHGTALDPIVDGTASVPRGQALGEDLTEVRGRFRFRQNRVHLQEANGRWDGGTVQARGHFTTEIIPKVQITGTWRDVDLKTAAAPYTQQVQTSGRSHGDVLIHGPADNLVIEGKAHAAGTLLERPLERLSLGFQVLPKSWRVSDVSARVDGIEVRGEAGGNLAGLVSGRFKGWVPFALFREYGVDAHGVGTLSGSFQGDALRPDSWEAAGNVQGEGEIERISFGPLSARWRYRDQKLHLTEAMASVGNGRLEGHGDFLLSEHPTASGEVTVRGLELADLNPLFDLPTLGKLSGQADGTLQLSWNGDLRAKGTVEGRSLSFTRLGRLDRVRGPIYWGHQVLTTPGMQAMLGGQPLQLGGSVSLTEKPRLDLSLRASNADVAPMLASFRWREILGASNASSHEKTLRVTLPGREQFTADGASWAAMLDHWQSVHQEPINQANLHLAKTPFWEAIKGKLFLDASLRGPLDDLGGHLKLQLREGNVYERPLDRAVLSATLAKNVLAVPYMEIQEKAGGLLMAQGKLGTPQERLTISGYHLKLDTFNPWLESLGMKIDGNGSFSVALMGTLEDPRIALSAKVAKGRVEDFVYDEASAEASISQGVLKIERASLAKDGKEATISGSYPLLDTGARIHLALRMEDESLGILTLFTKNQVEWQGGQGFVEVNLAGTPLHPNLSGRAELAGINLKVEGLKDPISRIRGSMVLDNNRLEVSPLSARFGQGEIQVTGQVAINNYLPQTMDLRVHSRPFKIRLENNLYDGLVEANLHLFGKMEKPTLSGMIVLSRGTVTIQPGPNEKQAEGMPLALKDLTLSLGSGVSLKSDPIPASLALDLTVQGALMVNGTLDSPVPRGTIKIKGGTVLALTNSFTVTDGKAEFSNTSISSNELEPVLDVQARSRLYDYAAREYLNVTALVTGTLQNLKLGFQSDRLDRDQDYILNILSKKQLIDQFLSGSNETENQLSGSSILTREATDLVSNYSNRFINGVFANRLENLVPVLDDVGFDLVTDPSLQKELSSVGFNFGFHAETKPLMNNLTLGYRHQFRNQNRDYYRWAMNYRLNRYLGLQLSAEPNDSPYGRPVAEDEKDGINGALQLTGQFRF